MLAPFIAIRNETHEQILVSIQTCFNEYQQLHDHLSEPLLQQSLVISSYLQLSLATSSNHQLSLAISSYLQLSLVISSSLAISILGLFLYLDHFAFCRTLICISLCDKLIISCLASLQWNILSSCCITSNECVSGSNEIYILIFTIC